MKDTIIERHGNTIFPVCIDLSIDYIAIIGKYQNRIGETDFLGGTMTKEDAADGAYWEIVKACRHKYMAALSRETAVAIANAMTASGHLYLADDLLWNNVTFAEAWSNENPDQPNIQHDIGFAI